VIDVSGRSDAPVNGADHASLSWLKVGTKRQARPPLLLLGGLLTIWLLWRPPSPDLAAQVYRVHLFSADGFSLWDNNWYGGHYLPDYSLVLPPLATLLGLYWTGVAAVTLSTLIFRRLIAERFGRRTTIATVLFVVGASGDLFIGRIAFALGVTLGLASVLALTRGHRVCCGLLSLACAAASPVAAAFLVLAAAADLATNRRATRAALLAGPALALMLTMAALFPEGGDEPFAPTSLLAAACATLALLLLLPPRDRLLRRGAALYLLALLLSYVVPSPMGSNVVRFGVLLIPPCLAGCIEVSDIQRSSARWAKRWKPTRRDGSARTSSIGRAGALSLMALLSTPLVLWQITGPLEQSVGASLDPASQYSFYVPVIHYLDSRSDGRPLRIEVPFTRSHWDATILGERFDLARGWERQLDTRYDGLFYAAHLTAGEYHSWLLETGVRFVALSNAEMDFSSVQEAALIRGGLPFLRPVFTSANWRVFAVRGAQPLASGPGELTAMDDDGFTLRAEHAGTFLVRVRYTPYWTVSAGTGSVKRSGRGWTVVTADRPGAIAIDAEFYLSA
jgi:hypothetical protein